MYISAHRRELLHVLGGPDKTCRLACRCGSEGGGYLVKPSSGTRCISLEPAKGVSTHTKGPKVPYAFVIHNRIQPGQKRIAPASNTFLRPFTLQVEMRNRKPRAKRAGHGAQRVKADRGATSDEGKFRKMPKRRQHSGWFPVVLLFVGSVCVAHEPILTSLKKIAPGMFSAQVGSKETESAQARRRRRMPEHEFHDKIPSVLRWCNKSWPPEARSQATSMASRLGKKPRDADLLTNLGNLIVRAVEANMAAVTITAPHGTSLHLSLATTIESHSYTCVHSDPETGDFTRSS